MSILGVFLRLAACALAAAAAFALGAFLAQRVSRARKSTRRLTAEEAVSDPVLCFVAFGAVALVLGVAIAPVAIPFALVAAFVLAQRAPASLRKRKQRKLREACESQLDVLAEIMALCMGAGLSFDAALGLYCSKFDNELSRCLTAARRQWEAGFASREEALEEFAKSIDSSLCRRFVATCMHAVQCGAPLSSLLVGFASDLREQRRTVVERQVQKAPVKMLIPTGACILPAMLILVMAPMLLQFAQTGT